MARFSENTLRWIYSPFTWAVFISVFTLTTVVMGAFAFVVAQSGIAGGARIGDGAVLAAQSGIAPFVSIGSGARIGGRAGVTKDVADKAAVSGFPNEPHAEWLRNTVRAKSIDELFEQVSKLEK